MAYAQMILGDERTGHDFAHATRVAQLAEAIIASDQLAVDQLVVMAAAYLHDTVDDKVVKNPESAQLELQERLRQWGYTYEQQQAILTIINNLSFAKEIECGKASLSLAGQIVQDADRLDALGAIGIARTLYFGGAHGDVLYDPQIPIKNYHSKAEYRQKTTTINHFEEKLFLIAESMNTTYAKAEAKRRKAFMVEFLEKFKQEWEND